MKHPLLLAFTLSVFLNTVVAQTSKTAEEEFYSFDGNKSGWQFHQVTYVELFIN